ncbi:MAG: Ig-like domain-containing protein [Planctomycetes bacterium]|nr:Ig-like domain-containing protein [Planctomycetota bacterium]
MRKQILPSTFGRSATRGAAKSAHTFALGAGMLAAVLLASCGTGKSTKIGSTAGAPGTIAVQPDPAIGSSSFVVEGNRRGQASDVKILGVYWGRLAAVADVSGEVQNRDYVIGENIRTNSIYDVTTNPITDQTLVTIQALAGTSAYEQAFLALDANLTPVQPKGLDANETGPFSMAPRNATLVVVFDDLLDPRFDSGQWKDSFGNDLVNASSGQLSKQVLKVRTGYPPASPYETRVVMDRNHGDVADFDGDGTPEFHPTRVIVSSTVTTVEAEASDPPLAVNSLGLPASIVTTDPNLALRIPTHLNPAVGQTQLLVNASGHTVGFTSNGPRDTTVTTNDVVRSMRSGGETALTGDLNNGFLLDEEPPRLIGNISANISVAPVESPTLPGRYTLPQVDYVVPACSPTPKVGDVVTQGNVKAQVVNFGTQAGPTIVNMVVQVIAPLGGELVQGSVQILTPYDPVTDYAPCFVRFSPNAGQAPNLDVSKVSQVVLTFSEPMDPTSLTAFDTMTVTRKQTDPTAHDIVVGRVVPSPDLRTFTYDHNGVPFAHEIASSERYYFNLGSGEDGPRDLAGNAIEFALPQVEFRLDPTEGTERNGGVALRFNAFDELFGDEFPELRNGQLLYDFQLERILPRPVARFAVPADRTQPVPSVMAPFVQGVQTPLSPLGSKLQTVWRYCDLGMAITDETNMNIDVETLAWSPIGANVVADTYGQFEVRLNTSLRLPDEVLDANGFPQWPNSGLVAAYASNFLSSSADPQVVVHPRDLGYVVNPADLYQNGPTTFLGFPLNRTIPLDQYRYYTWRDTAVLAKGGPSGAGAPPDQEQQVLQDTSAKTYTANQVRTIGLPLLMEYRCYPEDNALGLNAFDISLACNSSARPNFRAFSSGGYNAAGDPVVKNPDGQDSATGGYNPGAGGATTPGLDCSFYIGEAGLVTRVSRVHTIWFDANENNSGVSQATFVAPVIEPSPDAQPEGTSVVLAYRGAVNITNQSTANPQNDITTNAVNLDWYGDAKTGTGTVQFVGGLDTWKSDITQINTARFFQLRISFISNTVSSKTAELRSLGVAYRQL